MNVLNRPNVGEHIFWGQNFEILPNYETYHKIRTPLTLAHLGFLYGTGQNEVVVYWDFL